MIGGVRAKLALTVVATGLLTALLVIAAVFAAFERFEHETTFQRANAFLERIVAEHADLLDLQRRQPAEFRDWLRSIVLYEPDTQLYLLAPDGTVLVTSGDMKLPPGFKVALGPVKEAVAAAAGRRDNRYVMGDDPERMDAGAVVAARAVRRATIRGDDTMAGYLYLVCHKPDLPASRWMALRASAAQPAMLLIAAIVALTTALAMLVIVTVTRPLRRLTQAVSALSEQGLDAGRTGTPQQLLPEPTRDEFGALTGAFAMMLDKLRQQWNALRRLDQFRREGVSNLSHDLRSPLTATVACLETLESRWAGGAADPAQDRELVAVALRNTRNAARLVQSLGDLAQLDEPSFALRAEVVDAAELLDDIGARFSGRAAQQRIALSVAHAGPVPAPLDVELFERAVANLVDNALKFCPEGASITLAARPAEGGRIEVEVADTGAGIAEADVPHLFDRFFQSRASVAPATGAGGKGLGLAIVKRIAELHGGSVAVASAQGRGTRVTLVLPGAPTG